MIQALKTVLPIKKKERMRRRKAKVRLLLTEAEGKRSWNCLSAQESESKSETFGRAFRSAGTGL